MVTVRGIIMEYPSNCGCNNGINANYTLLYDTDESNSLLSCMILKGTTCRCGNGCHGLDRVPEKNMTFKSIKQMKHWIKS